MEKLIVFLMQYKKKMITLEALQAACPAITYESFHALVEQLMEQGMLEGVHSNGTDFQGLFRKYRIMTGPLFATVASTIRKDAFLLSLSGKLDISWYYSQPLALWQRDKADIIKVNNFLKGNDFEKQGSLQQRSYDIFGNEKLLTGTGHALLTHLHITEEDLGIIAESDPLMMAVHPVDVDRSVIHHLIVENRATYYGLLPFLSDSGFMSLILGYGWKIAGNLSQLPQQCCSPSKRHVCWYFGDFDWEGLRIWHSLKPAKNMEIHLAVPFYSAFLKYAPSAGKVNQEHDEASLQDFLSFFKEDEAKQFSEVFKKKFYYPQETLVPAVLQDCWKELCHEIGKFS